MSRVLDTSLRWVVVGASALTPLGLVLGIGRGPAGLRPAVRIAEIHGSTGCVPHMNLNDWAVHTCFHTNGYKKEEANGFG